MDYKLALITGASSGIGKEFAYKLASEKINLILVARNKQKLKEVSKEIELKFKVKTHIIVADLLKKEDINKVFLKSNKIGKVDLLINNAGFGSWGEYNKLDLNNELNMIELNVKTVYFFTRQYLEKMESYSKPAGIINVASVAGILPSPLYANYGATKAYVRQLTEAVQFELKEKKNKNVKLMILSPGMVETNFSKIAMHDKFAKDPFKGMKAKDVVNIAWKDFLKSKKESMPGIENKLYNLVNKLSRTITAKGLYKTLSKFIEGKK